MGPTWDPHGSHLFPTWVQHGSQWDPAAISHMGLTWFPQGPTRTHKGPTWDPHRTHMVSTCVPCGSHVGFFSRVRNRYQEVVNKFNQRYNFEPKLTTQNKVCRNCRKKMYTVCVSSDESSESNSI